VSHGVLAHEQAHAFLRQGDSRAASPTGDGFVAPQVRCTWTIWKRSWKSAIRRSTFSAADIQMSFRKPLARVGFTDRPRLQSAFVDQRIHGQPAYQLTLEKVARSR
jgi:hypothetical protein